MGRPSKHREEFPDKEDVKIDENASKNVLGALMNGYSEDHYNEITTKEVDISSGSLLLDSYIKVKSGSVIRLVGLGAELGKTSQSFVFADNYMKTMPKSKTFLVKAESRLSEEMKTRSGLKFVYKAEDWSYGSVFVLECNVFQTVATIIEKTLKVMYEQGEHLCVIIDSLDGLILKDDLKEKGIEDGVKIAGVPLLTKLLFKRLGLPINKYNALLIITGQYSASISLDPYAKNVPRQVESSGGSAIAHQCDYVLSYCPRFSGDWIKEKEKEAPDPVKNKILGVWATIEIKKSATDVSGMRIKIPIKRGRVGSAIWTEKEVVDLILMWELAKSAGAWITFSDSIIEECKNSGIELQPKINGINQLYDYFENNKPAFEFFRDWFKKKLF